MNKAQKFWDNQTKQYDEYERQSAPAFKEIIDKTKKYLDPEDTVLDFGCATGSITLALAPSVRSLLGLDFSKEMIKEAEKKLAASHQTNCSFAQGTIYNANLKPASFDRIISYSVLHLLDDSEEAILRIHELLKPGGHFICATACFREKKSFRKWLEVRKIRRQIKRGAFPLHINLYKAADVEKLIKAGNFQVVESEKIFTGITFSFIVARK